VYVELAPSLFLTKSVRTRRREALNRTSLTLIHCRSESSADRQFLIQRTPSSSSSSTSPSPSRGQI